MGHDIYGVNQNHQQVAYARFHMFNDVAHNLYQLLDSEECDGGVSGIGVQKTFSKEQIKQALDQYSQHYGHLSKQSLDMDYEQINQFLHDCLSSAEQDGSVTVCFA
ncbi:hypothetical protein ABID56_000635 [Alkalibacillus flavidus]|uniref:Uncharacterized protein n=2 Tax=Alkalibacillus flavidus TaxID=546021 RepID=A0ABV2KT43_9BACI